QGFIVPIDGPGDYTVTGTHAHTWVEAYLPGYGWYRFEPTPAYPADGTATGGNEAAPIFDEGLAVPVLGDPGEDLMTPGLVPDAGEPAPTSSAAPRGTTSWPAGLLEAVLAIALGLTLAIGLGRIRHRVRRKRLTPRQRIADTYESCRRLLLHLAAADPRPQAQALAARAASLTPIELADQARTLWPALAAPLGGLTERYYLAAYGPPGPSPDPVDEVDDLRRRFLFALKQEAGSLRYLLARLGAR
ncbi:MAG TPA: transglutaminase domain-containing protein, partial [Bacillota bacterium]